MSTIYSPMCLTTQSPNTTSAALHLCTACHAMTLDLLKRLLTMSRSYSPMCLLTQTRNASSGALHLCTACHAITLYLLKLLLTMSAISSPMCLSTQSRNASSVALHLCTAWQAITLYLLKLSVAEVQSSRWACWCSRRSSRQAREAAVWRCSLAVSGFFGFGCLSRFAVSVSVSGHPGAEACVAPCWPWLGSSAC